MDTRNQFWLDAVHFLAAFNPEERFVFVDMASQTLPRTPPWRVPKRFEKFSFPVQEMFASIGLTYIEISTLLTESATVNQDELGRLKTACTSSAISATRRTSPTKEGRSLTHFRRLEEKLLSSALQTLHAAQRIIENVCPDTVYIVNGRMPHQKAAILASEKKSVDTWFLEVYMEKLVRRRYEPNDRVQCQNHLRTVADGLSDERITSSVNSWLESYSNSKARQNPFANPDLSSINDDIHTVENLILFATSSRDEFESLEHEWNASGWESQYQAFGEAWKHLANRETSPVLRIHPNLLNKHPFHVREELSDVLKFLRDHPEFAVVSAGSKSSTYDLLEKAKVVVVHNSTVGLEASIRGIPVVCTNFTRYDMMADICDFRNPEDYRKLSFLSSKADPYGAMKWVAAQDFLDMEIPALEGRILLEGYSRLKQIARSIKDGSLASVFFDKRFCFYRIWNRVYEITALVLFSPNPLNLQKKKA